MNKIKKSVLVIGLLFSTTAYSQINTNGDPQNEIPNSNLFLDASNFNNKPNSLGKGLGFPSVDLTQFVFDTSLITNSKIASDFDGMLVYNSGDGETLPGQGQKVEVKPGFYYFYNPGNPGNITNGKWIRLQTDAAVGDTDINIYKDNGTLASDRTVNLNGNKLVFTGDGNVGIGTASPISKLNVRGGTLNIGNLIEYAGGLQVQNQDASKPVFTAYGTDNAEKMRIANDGNIGIGTNSPTQKLDVNGTARVRNKMMIGTDWTGGGALSVRNNVASDNIATFVSADNSYKAVLKDNGNFGIGTASPISKLNVRGGTLNIGNLTEYAGGLQVQNQDASKPVFTAYGTDNVEKMRIANNGNIGIGTNSPTQRLDVNGTVRLRNVPNGNAENDKVLVIDNNGVVKKSSLPPSPSFVLYATSNNYVWRNADNVARPLGLANTQKIYTDYIERVNANTFRVKKNGVYTIEVWAKFANLPVAGDGPRTGCTLRVNYGGDGVQLLGNRWQESTGTANVTKTVILNAGQQISTQTLCARTGNQQYQTAPGSSIFITYLPL